jgi:hydrogenase nickel incorporation protein HypB
MLLSKCDLLPYVPFNADLAVSNAKSIHPEIEVVRLSATTGEGFGAWMSWLFARQKARAAAPRPALAAS